MQDIYNLYNQFAQNVIEYGNMVMEDICMFLNG